MNGVSNDVHVLALVEAASKGDLDGVRSALSDGADINAIADKVYHTAITAATLHGRIEAVELLLAEGADPNVFLEKPALGIAAGRGDIQIVRMLLAAGADADGRSVVGETPLMAAAWSAQRECASLLLDHRADVHAVSVMEKTPLSEAYEYEWRFRRRNPVVDLLLAFDATVGAHDCWNHWKRPGGPEAEAEDSQRVIEEMLDAVERDDAAALLRLLDEGADPTDISYEDSYTPLGLAVEEGRAALVKAMLDRGARPDAGGAFPTSLMAAQTGRLDILRMLLEAGADPDLIDEDEESARAWAERNSVTDVLETIETYQSRPRTDDKADRGEYIPAE